MTETDPHSRHGADEKKPRRPEGLRYRTGAAALVFAGVGTLVVAVTQLAPGLESTRLGITMETRQRISVAIEADVQHDLREQTLQAIDEAGPNGCWVGLASGGLARFTDRLEVIDPLAPALVATPTGEQERALREELRTATSELCWALVGGDRLLLVDHSGRVIELADYGPALTIDSISSLLLPLLVFFFVGAITALVVRRPAVRESLLGGALVAIVLLFLWLLELGFDVRALLLREALFLGAAGASTPGWLWVTVTLQGAMICGTLGVGLALAGYDGMRGERRCGECSAANPIHPLTAACKTCGTVPTERPVEWLVVLSAIMAGGLVLAGMAQLGEELGFYLRCTAASPTEACVEAWQSPSELGWSGWIHRGVIEGDPGFVWLFHTTRYLLYVGPLFFLIPFLIGWRLRRGFWTSVAVVPSLFVGLLLVSLVVLGRSEAPYTLVMLVRAHFIALFPLAILGGIGVGLATRLRGSTSEGMLADLGEDAEEIANLAPVAEDGSRSAEDDLDRVDVSEVGGHRRLWPLGVLALIVCAVIGALAYRSMTAPIEGRVLVDVHFDGHFWETGADLARSTSAAIATRLRDYHLDAVDPNDADTMARLEGVATIEEAAAATRASFIVHVRIEPTEVPLLTGDERVALTVRAPIELRHVGGERLEVGTVDTWAIGRGEADARRVLADSIPDWTVIGMAPGLPGHAAFHAYLESDDVAIQASLEGFRAFVAAAREAAEQSDGAESAFLARVAQLRAGGRPATTHGRPLDQPKVAGTTERGVLILAEPTRTYQTLTVDVRRTYDLEEEVRVLGADGEMTSLYRTHAIYGSPAPAPLGDGFLVVDDAFGHGKRLRFVEGELSRVLRESTDERYGGMSISPDGSHVALWLKDCYRCDNRLVVLAMDDGSIALEDREATTFAWAGPRRIAALASTADGLVLFVRELPDTGAPTPHLSDTALREAHGLGMTSHVVATADASALVVVAEADDGSSALVFVGPDGALRVVRLAIAAPRQLALSRDAAYAALVDDRGLRVVSCADGALVLHVESDGDPIANPAFAPDASRVYFDVSAPNRGVGRADLGVVASFALR